MKTKQYLTFRWHDGQYGIEAALVHEIFPLPEVSPVPEAPSQMIGLLNLRGQVVPLLHLESRSSKEKPSTVSLQGHPLPELHLSDSVIIVQWENLKIGLVVHQINEVADLNTEVIETNPDYGILGNINSGFIAGVYQVDAGNILLIDLKTLMGQPDTLLTLVWDAQMQLDVRSESPIDDVEQEQKQEVIQGNEKRETPKAISKFYELYCPNYTLEKQAVFRERADNLKQQIESINITQELMPLAVIGFGNEYFGLDLELVREFTDISNLTPIPCCPKHIVGNMNLRGEIVTLVDIRHILNLPTPPVSVGSQAVVVQVDDIVAGFPVDRVLEMAYLNAGDMTPLSGILSDFGEPYLRGTAFFEEKIMRVLDLAKLLTKGELVVNEQA